MILPTKTLPPSRSLLGVGAHILRLLHEPKPVSRLWPEFQDHIGKGADVPHVSFGWFVLALDLLFVLGAIELRRGRLVRTFRDPSTV